MSELRSAVDYGPLLKGPSAQVANYIERHVAALSMNVPTKGGTIIQSVKGGVFLDLGFRQKSIGGTLVDIPTISNIQLGDMSSRGHGPKIVTIWESAFPDYRYFGADKVTYAPFWEEMGYRMYEGLFWLKRR